MNKYEIVTGRQENHILKRVRYAGLCIYKEDESLYKVHLNIFPNNTYYMRKNRGNGLFSIFSKITRTGKEIRLQDPVGHAKTVNNLKTHIAINFEVLNKTLYMSLYPKS